MKKVLVLFTVLMISFLPLTAFAAEGPMQVPDGASAEVKKHNEEGIAEWKKGNYEGALKHFSMASKLDSSIGETHFNEAISLDKIGKHGEATMHFKAAKKNASGNQSILNSAILNAHIGH